MEEVREKIKGLKISYYSEADSISDDFFAPCLGAFQKYDRAAGYFSSTALRHWAANVVRLTEDEDVDIRLLISPKISDSDFKAFSEAISIEKRREILADGGSRFLEEALLWETGEVSPKESAYGKILAWLVAQEKLEVRFAFNLSSGDEAGIFHKKIGIFYFPWGDRVAFTGSANETQSGHSINSESIDVYRSWDERDSERILGKEKEFEASWDADPEKLVVVGLSEESLVKVKEYSNGNPPDFSVLRGLLARKEGHAVVHAKEGLWPHQEKAFDAFVKCGNGVLEMATGTGKTRTAIAILTHLYLEQKIDAIVVSMAGNDLLAQWESDLRGRLTSVLGLTLLSTLGGEAGDERFLVNPKQKLLLCSRAKLAKVVEEFRKRAPNERLALVHDEVHDLGSPANIRDLEGHKDFFDFRLGLSATPDREFDDSGNQFIEQEIGDILYQFPLESAIEARILCPFDYYRLPYSLTGEDRSDLKQVYARKSAAEARGEPWAQERLWMELSRVYKKAREKPSVFAQFLADNSDQEFLKSTIIFVEDKEFGERLYQILIKHTHLYSQYFDSDHSSVLKKFAVGELDCLVTCHKISQGIDVPSLRNIVLFSSQRSRRETIQRLGRCLRSDPANPEKVARVIDFEIADESGNTDGDSIDKERVDWLSELSSVRPKLTKT